MQLKKLYIDTNVILENHKVASSQSSGHFMKSFSRDSKFFLFFFYFRRSRSGDRLALNVPKIDFSF